MWCSAAVSLLISKGMFYKRSFSALTSPPCSCETSSLHVSWCVDSLKYQEQTWHESICCVFTGNSILLNIFDAILKPVMPILKK